MRKNKAAQESGGSGWLVTYGDLMTLLLCFFVMLYATSVVDEEKWKGISDSLSEAFSGKVIAQVEEGTADSGPVEVVEEALAGEIENYLALNSLDTEVEVSLVEEGVLLNMKETILFDLGSAAIKTQGINVLDKLSGLFASLPYHVEVVGHTDNIPIQTLQYPSNWELAAARSCAIVRYYTSNETMTPKQMTCLSYGESQPIADNKTEAGREENRRVNFLVKVERPQLEEFVDIVETLNES